jgi:hypothetical protein
MLRAAREDDAMPVYRTNPSAESYGQAIGILLLDVKLPFIPGDVANASTFSYPVIYETVPGLTSTACVTSPGGFDEAVVGAARALVAQGVRGISSDCGFMLAYQDLVRDAVDVPVCLSSLLQLPFIARSLRPGRSIGVITADSRKLTPAFLARGGIGVASPIVVRGLESEPEFVGVVAERKGSLDSDRLTEEVCRVARRLVEEHPDVGAMLLECSMTPPYSKAVQDELGLPVYDFVTLIDFMQSGTHPRPPRGYM